MGEELITLLERLAALRASGALSSEEYEAQKAALLSGGQSPEKPTPLPTTTEPEVVRRYSPFEETQASEYQKPVWEKRRGLTMAQVVLIIVAIFLITFIIVLLMRDSKEIRSSSPNNEVADAATKGGSLTSNDKSGVDARAASGSRAVADSQLGGSVGVNLSSYTSMISSVDCSTLLVVYGTTQCALYATTNLPAGSASPNKYRSMVSDMRNELISRCSAKSGHIPAIDFIAQQAFADVYQDLAPLAVYGGDLSGRSMDMCGYKIAGSAASAGLLN